jgi:hypothetical protein
MGFVGVAMKSQSVDVWVVAAVFTLSSGSRARHSTISGPWVKPPFFIHQQLSGRAAGTILGRFQALFGGDGFPAPEVVLKELPERLRSAGLSRPKTSYVLGIAQKAVDGHIPTLDECDRGKAFRAIGPAKTGLRSNRGPPCSQCRTASAGPSGLVG